MSKHEASPNRECTETVSPASKNSKASYQGSRYGKNGNHPGDGDNSNDRIVTRG